MLRDFLEYVLETSPCFGERFTLVLLEHQDVIAKFRSPSRWKELSKETISEILPSQVSQQDLSNPYGVDLDPQTEVRGMSICLHQSDGVGLKRHHNVPIRDLNGVSVALVARPCGTTQVVTRGTTNDWYEVAGTRYYSYEVAGTRRVSVRGCRVEIQGNNEAVGGEQKDYNTLRSCNMSGG
ncbi:hypothetical protein Tco_0948614 [Tanacetum coccineum]